MKHNYTPVGLEQLSERQSSRLLNGHAVRVKHGSTHKVFLSTEQHKKLMKAHKKGSAVNLVFDPYQMEGHQHLKGEGLKSLVKGVSRHLVKHAKKEARKHIPKAKELLMEHAHKAVEHLSGIAEQKLQDGEGIGRFFKKAKKGLKSVGHALAPVGKVLAPIAKKVGKELLDQGIQMAEQALITGAMGGNVHHRRTRHKNEGQGIGRFLKKAKKGLKSVGHALAPVGKVLAPIAKKVGKELLDQGIQMAEQALITGAMGGSVHHRRAHYKRAGRPRKDKRGSGALMPAGMGFKGIDWEDRE